MAIFTSLLIIRLPSEERYEGQFDRNGMYVCVGVEHIKVAQVMYEIANTILYIL